MFSLVLVDLAGTSLQRPLLHPPELILLNVAHGTQQFFVRRSHGYMAVFASCRPCGTCEEVPVIELHVRSSPKANGNWATVRRM
jgi:hypothetical protein